MNKRNPSICVLVSGGLDSTVAYHYAITKTETVTPLFVDVGQPYCVEEQRTLQRLGISYKNQVANICTPIYGNGAVTPENQVIYGRNAMLAFFGALVAEETWLAALSTEINPTAVRDKHDEFFLMTSALMTFILKDIRHRTVVVSPFRDMTKTEVVALGLSLGLTPEYLRATRSCYKPGIDGHCGACSTCFKRWIAFTNNDLVEDGDFDALPWLGAYASEIYRLVLTYCDGPPYGRVATDPLGRFSQARIDEMSEAFHKCGLVL